MGESTKRMRVAEITSAPIRVETRQRLREWAQSQPIRPVLADVVSIAVERFISEESKR